MKILIEDLVVIFPYPLVFNEQVQYMTALKRTLDSQGHGLLQMPTGTGKTVCLLSLLIAYISNRDRYKKIIYCTRTVVQMEKTLNELKKLLKKIEDENPQCKKLLATGLTAKKNLCVHKHVNQWKSKQKVDQQCKKRTSDWVRAKRKDSIEQQQFLCQFYQNYKESTDKLKAGSDASIVFGMDDLKTYAQQHIRCPYYTAKDTIQTADIVVFNYLYLIDNKISGSMIKKMSKDSVVVFDEAHNIDDICIQSYTIRLNKRVLSQAQENVKYIKQKISHVQQVNLNAFQKQCTAFLNKINQDKQVETQTRLQSVQIDKSKILPSSILNSNNFLQCLQSVIKFYSKKLLEKEVSFSDPNIITADLRLKDMNIDESFMILASQKLMHLTNILQITQMNFFRALEVITTSLLYLASYSKGFKCVFQPNAMTHQYMQPTLTLACTDASIAMAAVFRNFPSVILTSGTISPLELYPKILNFKPVVLKSIDIQLTRNSIQPMIIASTADSTPISSEYLSRSNKAVTRNFANLILGLCDVVPDGILCFFPSYKYMQHVLKEWTDDKYIDQILEKRYLFIENKDPVQAGEQLNKYRHACDIGRGAIFFAISRGKIAEGIDFQQQYGRCVIMMGFPVQNSHQLILLQRIKYMVQQKQFDTMRQVAQCLGRVMRKKTDYGLMILADSRFNAPGKYNKLPQWIKKAMDKQLIDVTMQTANMYAAKFFRSMGQPFVLAQRLFKREAYFKQGVLVQEAQNRRLAQSKKLLDILKQEQESDKRNEQQNRSQSIIHDDQDK